MDFFNIILHPNFSFNSRFLNNNNKIIKNKGNLMIHFS